MVFALGSTSSTQEKSRGIQEEIQSIIQRDCIWNTLPRLEELQAYSALIGDDIYAVLTLEGSVAARNHVGGTAPAQVKAAIQRVRKQLS